MTNLFVYRLYGPMEEEIKIQKGQSNE